MASEQWNNDIAYAMTPFKLITWPIGIWPLQIYNIYSLLRCVLGTCCASLVVILPSMELYMGCTDIEQNVDCLMLIGCGLLGRILCCSMLGFSYFSCLIYGIIPFLNYNQDNWINITNEDMILEYTMPSRCALEYFNFPTSIYKLTCLVETVIMILATTANLGNDALFLNITLHVCGQINILRIRFINFDVTSPRINDRFNTLIQRHRYLITLTRELADLISFILLMELFIISILLCIVGFQFIFALKVNNTVMIGKSLMVLSAIMTQLTLYGFMGNYLKSEMEDIGLSVYQSAWYNFPENLTKNVIFILMQTKSSVTLQAGNFIVINLSTYVSILKTSFSYLSVLRIMLEV
ncbi:odorant receptor 13a-like isoform X2 [Polyergus mexicanus]|uniref:odorant receptor 13a-like isoform X2 n=1 Tax=Polyergus mexicanus TaxID=615972 RepID=UPI0038B677B3